MRALCLFLGLLFAVGCGGGNGNGPAGNSSDESEGARFIPAGGESEGAGQTLTQARRGFVTKIVRRGDQEGAAPEPPRKVFSKIKYDSAVGPLAAYVTPDPGDGERHAAVIWITGGDSNTIDDLWSPRPRENDQTARGFREAGLVMMFPSLRGGNDNPGQREGFYGEVDDVLAAADYLAKLPYVDPARIYLGGHSTGGTLVMLVAEMTDRFPAVFALGPVASPEQYGGQFMYCDLNDEQEVKLRAPAYWFASVRSPLYVFEGVERGNWEVVEMMQQQNTNDNIRFFGIEQHDHFSIIVPLTELLAERIHAAQLDITEGDLQGL